MKHQLWAKLCAAHPKVARLNVSLFKFCLHGLGVLNFETATASGEEWLLRTVLARRLPPDRPPVLFDVGANCGEYTLLLRAHFPAAEIHSFEPSPGSFAALARACPHSRNHLHNQALGAAADELALYDYADAPAGSAHASLYPSVIQELHGRKSKPSLVRVQTLDAFCQEHSVAVIDFLKLDTEGHELKCLEGAGELLRQGRIRAVQFEFNQMNIHSRVFMQDFFRVLAGWSLYRLLPGGLLPLHPQATLETNLFHFQNIVALPDQSAAQTK